MKAIYEPKGKAGEYAKLACNLYKGCGHGCTYCYAPAAIRMDREEFHNNPQPRKGIIEALERQAKSFGNNYIEKMIVWTGLSASLTQLKREDEIPPKPERPVVFLCFTTDPYQPINQEHQLTRKAIEILHANEIGVNILTKGVITDFDLLAKKPNLSRVGVTITFASHLEPGRPNAGAVLQNIITAKNNNIATWVSFEPVIYPDSVLHHIDLYAREQLVDEYKLGKWNYDKRANDIDWERFANKAVELLEKLNCNYVIKEDLKKYLDRG